MSFEKEKKFKKHPEQKPYENFVINVPFNIVFSIISKNPELSLRCGNKAYNENYSHELPRFVPLFTTKKEIPEKVLKTIKNEIDKSVSL